MLRSCWEVRKEDVPALLEFGEVRRIFAVLADDDAPKIKVIMFGLAR
jgi:hypothetical protein